MSNRLLAGRYELLEKIGDGGMAVVYKAKDKLLNRYVAIKILRPEFTKDATFVENFKRESQAAAGLAHPNIVAVYDVGREGNINYIVMELVNGRTLNEIIDEQAPMDYRTVIKISKEVASALKVAHKNKIIHRDVKPHNIMITTDGNVKLADFGIAKAVNDATLSTGSKVIGSVHYFSPEQARGNYVDERSDIYSLGIVMYEMLTGRVPFDGDNPVSIALKHINEEIIPPSELVSGIPPQLERCVLKATSKFQTNRYNSADELIEELDNIEFVTRVVGNSYFNKASEQVEKQKKLDEERLRDPVDDDDDDSSGGGSRRRGWLIALIVLLLLAVGGAGYYWFTHRPVESDEVEVPDLTDLTMEQARARANEYELTIKEGENVYSTEIAENRIADQDPHKGTTVKKGTTVTVYLSKGSKEGTIPNLIGMNEQSDNIKSYVESYGYKLGKIREETSTERAGQIIIQDPAPGPPMEKGADINIWVSNGKGVEEGKVPPVTGLTYEEAKRDIEDAGFKVGKVEYYESNVYGSGYVMYQQYDAGFDLKLGSSIDLEISKGAPQVNDDPGGASAGDDEDSGDDTSEDDEG